MFKISRLFVSSLLAPVALIAFVGASGTANAGGTVVNADFCVDATHFRFMVDVTEPFNPAILVVQIGADFDPFNADDVPSPAPTEIIAVNFDQTGTLVTTLFPSVVPSVASINVGSPPDRWANESPINDFTLTSFGAGEWRFEGSVPHGTQPITAGDTVAGTALVTRYGPPPGHLQGGDHRHQG